MSTNLVPIQITLQAANAADAKQLVQDLAGTMSGMPDARIPAETSVSAAGQAPVTATVEAPYQPPTQPVPTQAPYQPQPTQQPVPTAAPPAQVYTPPAPAPTQVPTSAPTYDLTQLGVAAQPIVDAGRSHEIVAWLQQHGAQALTMLNPNLYGEFATFLRSLGAKI